MDSFIATWRPVAEILYFISQIILAAGLILAYKQLRTVKQDSMLRIKRTSAEKAIESCDRYISNAVPCLNEFYKLCETNGFSPYKGKIGDFSRASIANSDLKAATERFAKLTWGEAINQLEMLAAILVSGVGDEEVAFPVIGRSFCKSVESHYDLICICRGESSPDSYQNIVALYQIWQSRVKKLDLALQKARLDASINCIPDRKLSPLEAR